MRILVVHQYYCFPGLPGGSRFNEFARLWAKAGHEVTVIAGSVSHATGQAHPAYVGRWLTRERDGDVDVIRCYVPRSYRRSYAGRAWGFLGFLLSSATAALTAKADVVIATSPPLMTVITGWLAARVRHRAPLIFEVRDLWPESAVTTGVLSERGALTKCLYRLEAWGYRVAERVNVLTPAFREDILRRELADAEKIVLVPNGADQAFFEYDGDRQQVRAALGWNGRTVFLYAGAHGRANAIGQLVDTADKLRHRHDILIALAGDGPERAKWQQVAAARGLSNILFHGPQAKDHMPAIVDASDVGVAVLQDNPTFRTVYPNKVFDYMACGRPVLLAIDGAARDLVCVRAKAGIFAEPEDASAIASQMEWMADHPDECARMGEDGRAWVRAHASRDALASRYLDIMRDLVSTNGTG
ncbi:MAG: glycosyltransferase [Luteitalea sp.]|nr:glycosyltransferase [Luteitalea sp.]